MDIDQTVADLVQREGGLCILDRIAFPLPYNTDAVACKFGLGAELYLPDLDRAALCERTARFLTDYWQTFPQHVNRFLANDSR